MMFATKDAYCWETSLQSESFRLARVYLFCLFLEGPGIEQFWWWSFQECHPKWNFTLHTNLTCSNEFFFFKLRGQEAIKIWHFSIFNVDFLCRKSAAYFWKRFSCMNIWIVQQLILRTFHDSWHFWSTLFSKNVPNFWWLLALSIWKNSKFHLARLKLVSKIEFNFGWHTWKLHYQNCFILQKFMVNDYTRKGKKDTVCSHHF